MTLALALTLLAPQTFDVRLRPTSKPVVLNALEHRTQGKWHTVLGTRFEIDVRRGLKANLVIGPFTTQGRTFGRSKTRSIGLTPQATLLDDGMARPPFLLSVPLPGHPVKVGEAWTAVLVGPTPMPAGVKATFRALGPAKIAGATCLRIGVKLDTDISGTRITGGGLMLVRMDDGLVQTGSLNVLLVYQRADPVTRKMAESARVSVKAHIARAG